jgi:hypothetical protein
MTSEEQSSSASLVTRHARINQLRFFRPFLPREAVFQALVVKTSTCTVETYKLILENSKNGISHIVCE